MAFCSNCGAKMDDGAKFCTVCGYAPEAASAAGYQQPYTAAAVVYTEPSDITSEFSPEDIEENRKLAALVYLGVFLWLPFLAAPKSEYCRFHANQAVSLFILYLLCSLCMIVPFIGWIVGGVGYIVTFIFNIMGFCRAWNRKAKKLPICGSWVFFKYKIAE